MSLKIELPKEGRFQLCYSTQLDTYLINDIHLGATILDWGLDDAEVGRLVCKLASVAYINGVEDGLKKAASVEYADGK